MKEVKESKKMTDDRWEEMVQWIRKLQRENLSKGIKPKSIYQIEKECGLLKTFGELSPDIQGFLKGENDDMFIASWIT